MNSKKWLKIFVVLSLMSVGFVGGINYVVDPYGYNNMIQITQINKHKYSNTSMTARYKSNILTNGKFDAIMLGTSRIGVMNPEVANKYLNSNTFNLEYPGSNTEIQNKLFKYATKFNDVKYLIYGIDFMSFNKTRTIEQDFKEFHDLQDKIENFDEVSNFKFYFNLNTFITSGKLVLKNILGLQNVEATYLAKNGMRDYKNHIHELENNTLKLDKNIDNSIRSYFKEDGIYKNYKFSKYFLDYFKDTIEYCKKNNIEIVVYIPPMYSDHFDAIAQANYFDEFELFKKELSKVTDFVDFTGHNFISKNKDNYWDSSHLRKEMTEIVMAKIFNDKSVQVPKDFGVLVTKENIDEHLENLRNQIQNYDLNKTLQK